jgi:hypothetical protein
MVALSAAPVVVSLTQSPVDEQSIRPRFHPQECAALGVISHAFQFMIGKRFVDSINPLRDLVGS